MGPTTSTASFFKTMTVVNIRAEKAAWLAYEHANAAKQAADELLAQAKARLAREIDVMIEATA